jgi:hypothetical protein
VLLLSRLWVTDTVPGIELKQNSESMLLDGGNLYIQGEGTYSVKMAQKIVPDFEQHWIYVYNSLQSEYSDIVTQYPDAEDAIKQVGKVLSDIVSLAGCTPSEVGESMKWQDIVSATTEDRLSYCKPLKGKQLFKALYGLYTITLGELRAVLQSSVQHKKKNPGAEIQRTKAAKEK